MKRRKRRRNRSQRDQTAVQAQQAGGDDPTARFPRNPVLFQPTGFQPTAFHQEQAAKGRMVFFLGRVIALVDAIVAFMDQLEAIWYYRVEEGDSLLTATDVIIPRQSVSMASCTVDPTEVLRCARRVERDGGRIGFAGHDHGADHLGLFTSGQDWSQLETQCSEGLGLGTTVPKATAGEVRIVDDPSRAGTVYEARFGRRESVRISTPGAPQEMTVELIESQRAILSYFSTSSRQGHLVAGLEAVHCTRCGGVTHRKIPPEEITACVIGPMELDVDRDVLHAELREKVRTFGWGAYGANKQGASRVAQQPVAERSVVTQSNSDVGQAGQTRVGQDYEIWRGGEFIGRVTPACLEESAAKCDKLSGQLGWSSSSTDNQT